MPLLAVTTTLPDWESARALARDLVSARLAACAQLEGIESAYYWDQTLHQEPEVRLLLKTTSTCWPRLHQALRAGHPYELPAIVAWPLDPVDPDYAAWVTAAVVAP